jgi:hypothetical protein
MVFFLPSGESTAARIDWRTKYLSLRSGQLSKGQIFSDGIGQPRSPKPILKSSPAALHQRALHEADIAKVHEADIA